MKYQVAKIIREQLGERALFMLGAKSFIAASDFFEFEVMQNALRVTHVRITLTPSDTYTLRFFRVGRAPRYALTERAQVEGVYVDRLHETIEEHTGLLTRLH